MIASNDAWSYVSSVVGGWQEVGMFKGSGGYIQGVCIAKGKGGMQPWTWGLGTDALQDRHLVAASITRIVDL